jgi:hypothetical protein
VTFDQLQGWALLALAVTGPPSSAWALSKLWIWNGDVLINPPNHRRTDDHF